ncbi:MAG: lipase family protein, partial [Rhodospirillaceae bacterium]|nr:lipase family protein [Rhodospirillaceae bacterium]
LSPPQKRPAYSDRMAYVLAEMSDIAYIDFEGAGGVIKDAVGEIQKLGIDSAETLKEFLDSFSLELMGNPRLDKEFLAALLKKSNFELLKAFSVAGTQGFACKSIVEGEPPYIVIAFRGTEQKVSDWLTDLNAVPKVDGKEKVHTGFWKAFNEAPDGGPTARDVVKGIMDSSAAKDDSGAPLPLFITGHSLGGALALMATKALALNIDGACYTFGAPRIANYDYFKDLKTPIYRVVNSSDIVPRVPPGATMQIAVGVVKLLSWLTGWTPAVSSLFEKLEGFLDRLNGYRHAGDLRYLTDVAAGKFEDVRLLSNPPAIDRIVWLWKNMAAGIFVPVKAHSMSIYRKKLQYIAKDRLQF